MTNERLSLGKKGEELAVAELKKLKFKILERNYKCILGEVDIVAKEKGTLVFVEVKTRAGTGYGAPQEAITLLKRREVEAVAAQFVDRHGLHGLAVRFDAVAIVVLRRSSGSEISIEHVEDAWRPGWP